MLLPTIDLHVHLRGTLNHGMARRLAAKNCVDLPDKLFRPDGNYRWRGSAAFLQVYDAVCRVLRKMPDLRTVAQNYLMAVGHEGTIYVEFMLSPGQLLAAGISYEEQLLAVAAAADKAREFCGIESRL